ncbi:MAG: hypothetical protein KUG78_07040, partial [Kangiellaceae bacterium]|nr:hypothetical protein [Kangiellaceae bacterium]
MNARTIKERVMKARVITNRVKRNRLKFVLISLIASYSLFATAESNLVNAVEERLEVEKSITQSLSANKTKLEDNWLTYRIAMEPKNGMPCCFQGR